MQYSIEATQIAYGGSESHYVLNLDDNKRISLDSRNFVGGTRINSIEEVRAILIEALTNPQKFERLCGGGSSLTLQVYKHSNSSMTYHDRVTINFND